MRQLALVSDLIEWLRPAFSSLGYLIVGLGMFLESAAFVGVVVPGDVLLAVGGAYAQRGVLELPIVIALGTVCGILGETVGYWLGRRYGEGMITKTPLLRRFAHKLEGAQEAIRDNGGKTLVLGRFTTGAAGMVPFVAGTSGVEPRTFFLYAIPTVTVWAIAVSTIGYVVGANLDAIDRILNTIGGVGIAVVAVVIAVAWFVRRRRRTSQETAADR